MKTFFGSIFMEKEALKEVGIYHPIKLEYYKIIHEDEIVKRKTANFGIDVIKTEYRAENVKVENKEIQYLSNDETRLEEILNLFKEHEVTPTGVEDILIEFSKKVILI